eukprot:2267261-Lingulodinium_polyedra.AAC.1
MRPDGWRYRFGCCVTLPELFVRFGQWWSAAELYTYYNLSKPLATKRPRPWSSPFRTEARRERFRQTGRYGLARA